MATTVSNFTAIDDTAVDAESPITESLMKQLRDNAYWVNAGTQKTSETTANKFLETAGSGVLQWTSTSSLGVNGTKGEGTVGTSSGSPSQIAEVTDRILNLHIMGIYNPTGGICANFHIFIDQSDLTYTFVAQLDGSGSATNSERGSGSGTLTGSFATLNTTSAAISVRVTGGNVEFYETMSGAFSYHYIWL